LDRRRGRGAGGTGAGPLNPIPVIAVSGLPAVRWGGRAALLFRRSVYFSDGNDAMVAVVGRSAGASPAGFRLATETPANDWGLGTSSWLKFDGSRWTLDGRHLAIDGREGIEEAARWESLPRIAPLGSLADRLAELVPDLDQEWNFLFWQAHAFARLRPVDPMTGIHAATLIGRGSGSTPIGDDFLAGWLGGLARQGHAELPVHRTLAARLVDTCRLSRHFLHHALAGRFHSGLVRLARLSSLPAKNHPLALALAAQGDRSGRAALAGYATGIYQGA